MRRIRRGFLSSVLTLLAVILIAAEDLGRLKGTVDDRTGAAVVKASVIVVWDLEGCKAGPYKIPRHSKKIKLATNDRGEYSVELSPEKYEVIVSSKPFRPACRDVEIAAGKTTELHVTLESPQVMF